MFDWTLQVYFKHSAWLSAWSQFKMVFATHFTSLMWLISKGIRDCCGRDRLWKVVYLTRSQWWGVEKDNKHLFLWNNVHQLIVHNKGVPQEQCIKQSPFWFCVDFKVVVGRYITIKTFRILTGMGLYFDSAQKCRHEHFFLILDFTLLRYIQFAAIMSCHCVLFVKLALPGLYLRK